MSHNLTVAPHSSPPLRRRRPPGERGSEKGWQRKAGFSSSSCLCHFGTKLRKNITHTHRHTQYHVLDHVPPVIIIKHRFALLMFMLMFCSQRDFNFGFLHYRPLRARGPKITVHRPPEAHVMFISCGMDGMDWRKIPMWMTHKRSCHRTTHQGFYLPSHVSCCLQTAAVNWRRNVSV